MQIQATSPCGHQCCIDCFMKSILSSNDMTYYCGLCDERDVCVITAPAKGLDYEKAIKEPSVLVSGHFLHKSIVEAVANYLSIYYKDSEFLAQIRPSKQLACPLCKKMIQRDQLEQHVEQHPKCILCGSLFHDLMGHSAAMIDDPVEKARPKVKENGSPIPDNEKPKPQEPSKQHAISQDPLSTDNINIADLKDIDLDLNLDRDKQ